MLLGIFLLITTGLLWVVIGSVISSSARKGKNLDRIQADSALLCILVCIGWLWCAGAHFPSPLITILLILAGAANYFTFLLMNRAMQLGHHGIVWSLVQSALICPFLMEVIFLGVACPVVRIAGIIGILSGILLAGVKRREMKGKTCNNKWFFVTLAAFAMAGFTQCLANLPSYLNGEGGYYVGKAFALQLGTLLAFGVRNLRFQQWRGTVNWKPMLILSGATLVAQCFFLYRGLDLVVQAGVGAIGYPIALGSCIVGFALYSAFILREKVSFLSATSTSLCLIGIILLSLA